MGYIVSRTSDKNYSFEPWTRPGSRTNERSSRLTECLYLAEGTSFQQGLDLAENKETKRSSKKYEGGSVGRFRAIPSGQRSARVSRSGSFLGTYLRGQVRSIHDTRWPVRIPIAGKPASKPASQQASERARFTRSEKAVTRYTAVAAFTGNGIMPIGP